MVPLNETVPPQPRPEPARDRYGRYLIPDPETGKERAWTRATTFASTIADQRGIDAWHSQLTAIGLSRRQDLLAAVASVRDPFGEEGKRKVSKAVEQAQEHAGVTSRATIGSAVHAWTAALDAGEESWVPDPWRADCDAYRTELGNAGLEVSPNYIERVCLLPELGVAGTMDRLARYTWGSPDARANHLPLILDVKTGRDLRYSWGEIATQVAIYAHARYTWDEAARELHEMLAVNRDWAIVAHLPAGEGRCSLYSIDLRPAWEMVAVCGAVRAWRRRRDLAVPLLAQGGGS